MLKIAKLLMQHKAKSKIYANQWGLQVLKAKKNSKLAQYCYILKYWIIKEKLTSLLSNTQAFVPSGWISFHHLNPTSNLPVTFLTVQKSNDNNKTQMMKMNVLRSVNNLPKRYIAIAPVRNNKWNTKATGWLNIETDIKYIK
jgi:hypothetical protein